MNIIDFKANFLGKKEENVLERTLRIQRLKEDALDKRIRGHLGKDKEETTFVDCEAWGRTATLMTEYAKKGRVILAEGRLKQDNWTDRVSGGKRSKLIMVVDNFDFQDFIKSDEQEQTQEAQSSVA